MAHINTSASTPTTEYGWINPGQMPVQQDSLAYFSAAESVLTSVAMCNLDLTPSVIDSSVLQQVSPQSLQYSASSSPVSFPASPLLSLSHQGSLSPAAPLLDGALFENLGLENDRHRLMTHSPDQALSTLQPGVSAEVYNARLLASGNGIHHWPNNNNNSSQSPVHSWSGSLLDHQPTFHHVIHSQSPEMEVTAYPSQIPAWGHTQMHSQQPLVHPQRSTSQWHPYSRHHSYPQPSDCFDSHGARQLSAPASPVFTHDGFTSPMGSQLSVYGPHHRRSQSTGHELLHDLERRLSEGEIIDQILPGLSPASGSVYPHSSALANSSSSASVSSTDSRPSWSPAPAVVSEMPVPGVYKCEYAGCNKSFSRPYNLNSHIRTHTNLRPYRCEHCDRSFARLHDKNRHERLHRGVRPFACERCNHHFARMDALNRHLKVEGGRNLCNTYLIEHQLPGAVPIVDLPPKKINPLILAHFPDFGKEVPEKSPSPE